MVTIVSSFFAFLIVSFFLFCNRLEQGSFVVLCCECVITSDKGGGKCVCPRSVCLLARLLKNACMDLDEMLHVNKCWDMDELINF